MDIGRLKRVVAVTRRSMATRAGLADMHFRGVCIQDNALSLAARRAPVLATGSLSPWAAMMLSVNHFRTMLMSVVVLVLYNAITIHSHYVTFTQNTPFLSNLGRQRSGDLLAGRTEFCRNAQPYSVSVLTLPQIPVYY